MLITDVISTALGKEEILVCLPNSFNEGAM
jgi:hypothetical protein